GLVNPKVKGLCFSSSPAEFQSAIPIDHFMNTRNSLLMIVFSVLCVPVELRSAQQPNIVLILGEAQGWASMSEPLDDRNVRGSKSDFINTPNLDSIAKAGVRFSDFYAASPRCTPTR